MKTYAQDLTARIAKGELTEITEFKGEFEWLSNFYLGPGMDVTVEHKFQAAKFGSGTLGWINVMRCGSPGIAKKLGRTAELPADWGTRRDRVMEKALREKFYHPVMREWLIATHPVPIKEGNWWHDNYWGDCQCQRCQTTPGINKLGSMLMQIREELVEEQLAWFDCEVNAILDEEERRHRGE